MSLLKTKEQESDDADESFVEYITFDGTTYKLDDDESLEEKVASTEGESLAEFITFEGDTYVIPESEMAEWYLREKRLENEAQKQ